MRDILLKTMFRKNVTMVTEGLEEGEQVITSPYSSYTDIQNLSLN
jgi:hypothetical protein